VVVVVVLDPAALAPDTPPLKKLEELFDTLFAVKV
jgi:hypothetical protein